MVQVLAELRSRTNAALWLALVAVALLPGCSSFFGLFGRPTIEDVRPKLTGIDLLGVNLAFEIDVKNPYYVPLISPRLRYGIDVEGEEFMASQESEGLDVAARSVGTVVLPVRIDYVNIARAYKTLSKLKEFRYRLHGALVFSAMGRSFELPLSYEGRAPVVRPPRFSNITVRFSKVSLTSAAVTVEADMHNPNIFDVGINSLGYVLRLGEAQVGNVTAATAGKIAAGKTGRLTLTGRISAAGALFRLARGGSLGAPSIQPTGAIETPYGAVKLGK